LLFRAPLGFQGAVYPQVVAVFAEDRGDVEHPQVNDARRRTQVYRNGGETLNQTWIQPGTVELDHADLDAVLLGHATSFSIPSTLRARKRFADDSAPAAPKGYV
jgi:hypothetical protein